MLPFHAEYKLFHGSKEHGSGYYKLEVLENGHYKMGYQSAGKWFFLEDIRTETSQFTWLDGQLQPNQYQMKRKGSGPDFGASVQFLELGKKIIARYKDREVEHAWQEQIVDPLLYHQQLRLDVEAGKQEMFYKVAYKTKLRDYHYRVLETEQLKLDLGEYKAIKVERVRGGDSNKATFLWLIPELNYVLGKVSHYEDGKLKVNMILDQLR